MSDTPSFDIPPQMRDMAEKNVEQARTAFGQFMELARQAQELMVRSHGAIAEGAREVQQKAMRYTQDNLDASFAFASDLARARDVQEALEIQTRYAQRQVRTYAEQSQDLGRTLADTAQKMQPRG